MSEIPAEIAAAIDAYGLAAEQFGGMICYTFEDGAAVERARAALNAVILKHLGRSALSETTGEGK